MAHKGSLRRIFKKYFVQSKTRRGRLTPGSFALSAATSYYLPEGRYYEAPVMIKKTPYRPKKVFLYGLFGVGFSLSNISSLQQHAAIPYIAANASVSVRDDKNRYTKKVSAHKMNAPLMIASLKQQHPPLIALAMQIETKKYHMSSLIRPYSDTSPAVDEPLWTAALMPIFQQWAQHLSTHVDSLTQSMIATTIRIEQNVMQNLAHNLAIAQTKLTTASQQQMALAVTATPKTTATPEIIEQETLFATATHAMISSPNPAQSSANLAQKEETSKISMPPLAKIPVPKQKELPSLPVPKMLASLVTNDRPDILALGYAPGMSKNLATPFDSILTEEEKNKGRFTPPIGSKDHAWAANPLPPLVFTEKEQKCLAEAIYFESRGEQIKGQAAVAQVVLNRVRNPAYPTTICGVVYQNSSWRNRCQFSFACDGRRRKVTNAKHWQVAKDIAKAVTAGQIWLPNIGSSTHYHAVYVRPVWARSMYKLEKIGLHIFYRTKGGGWS